MARAPREHTVRFQPLDRALTGGDAALRADAARAAGALGAPSVLTLATTALGNDYGVPPKAKKRPSAHPLRFACVVGGVCWRFFQGADPLAAAPTLAFVAQQLQPQIVVRLNEWPAATRQGSAPAALAFSTYGPRCARVLSVPDLVPAQLRVPPSAGPGNTHEHELALMLRELFELLLALAAQFPAPTAEETASVSGSSGAGDSSSSSSSGDDDSDASDDSSSSSGSRARRTMRPRLPRVVYIHCAAGKERSRFVMLALHGALYALASPLGPVLALRAWAERQMWFGHAELSLRAVLTRDPDDMFPVLAHAVARLAGAAPGDGAAVLAALQRAERALSIRGNYHNVCAAGAACPFRSEPVMQVMCARCHAALFCGIDCFMRCSHLAPDACAGHFDTHADAPLRLRASVFERHKPRRARSRSSGSGGGGGSSVRQ